MDGILAVFGKLRIAIIICRMSVRPSICPYGTTQLPIDRFLLNLISVYFSKSVQKILRQT